ncbi:MAG: hypothetical protein ABIY52_02920 [Gemmatimonadaceae bacterium]
MTWIEALSVPVAAVIIALPAATPTTVPADTVATEALELLQVTGTLSSAPVELLTVALSEVLAPIVMSAVTGGMMVTIAGVVVAVVTEAEGGEASPPHARMAMAATM